MRVFCPADCPPLRIQLDELCKFSAVSRTLIIIISIIKCILTLHMSIFDSLIVVAEVVTCNHYNQLIKASQKSAYVLQFENGQMTGR